MDQTARQEVVMLVRDHLLGGRNHTSLVILSHIKRVIPDVTLSEVRQATVIIKQETT